MRIEDISFAEKAEVEKLAQFIRSHILEDDQKERVVVARHWNKKDWAIHITETYRIPKASIDGLLGECNLETHPIIKLKNARSVIAFLSSYIKFRPFLKSFDTFVDCFAVTVALIDKDRVPEWYGECKQRDIYIDFQGLDF